MTQKKKTDKVTAAYLAASERISEPSRLAYNKYVEFANGKKWADYKELLPAFAEHMGMRLIVKERPEGSIKIGEANGIDIYVYEKWGVNTFYFAYFHEMGHNVLHYLSYGVLRPNLVHREMEIEADLFAAFFMEALFPESKESTMRIMRANPIVTA